VDQYLRFTTTRPFRPREVRSAGVRPTKSLGQHFLSDWNVVHRIVSATIGGPNDTVIEVGPGLGVLTQSLAEQAGRLIAVEIDARLARRLEAQFAEQPSVSVMERDVLALPGHEPEPRDDRAEQVARGADDPVAQLVRREGGRQVLRQAREGLEHPLACHRRLSGARQRGGAS